MTSTATSTQKAKPEDGGVVDEESGLIPTSGGYETIISNEETDTVAGNASGLPLNDVEAELPTADANAHRYSQ